MKRTLIAAFCIFHMVAVGVYALPDSASKKPGIQKISQMVRPITRPYMLATSQWQKWPLFAPDPLRRVVEFRIQALENGQWETVERVAGDTIAWWRRGPELKIVRRLEKEDRKEPIRKQYTRLACAKHNLSPGTRLRLLVDEFLIPKHSTPQTIQWWREWEPEISTRTDLETRCPSITL